MVIPPVVVRVMGVSTRVPDRADPAAEKVGAAMLPKADTSVIPEKFECQGVGSASVRQPPHAHFLRAGHVSRKGMFIPLGFYLCRGEFFHLTGALRTCNVVKLIKTDRGIGPLTSGQPSVQPNGANSCEGPPHFFGNDRSRER